MSTPQEKEVRLQPIQQTIIKEDKPEKISDI